MQEPSTDRTPTSQRRRVCVEFASAEDFQLEYRRNIANGGIFAESSESFHIAEELEVELRLLFRDQSILLPGEVVSHVPLRFVPPGGSPGAAVQFLLPVASLRERLDPIACSPLAGFSPRPGIPEDRRKERRAPARVEARVETDGLAQGGRTCDLSQSGALVSVEGAPIPVGRSVNLTLVHPTRGSELQVSGTVVRQGSDASGTPVVAIDFGATAAGETACGFIESVQAADHSRRLGAIAGPIDLLGFANLLQMLSSSTDRGTLRVAHGALEGMLTFDSGAILSVTFGIAAGTKALCRMLALRSGNFEFRADLDPSQPSQPTGEPLPIYSAVLEAVSKIDEQKRLDTSPLPTAARVGIHMERLAEKAAGLDELQREVVDLASGGATVRGILDALPHYDADIYAALLELHTQGLLTPLPG